MRGGCNFVMQSGPKGIKLLLNKVARTSQPILEVARRAIIWRSFFFVVRCRGKFCWLSPAQWLPSGFKLPLQRHSTAVATLVAAGFALARRTCLFRHLHFPRFRGLRLLQLRVNWEWTRVSIFRRARSVVLFFAAVFSLAHLVSGLEWASDATPFGGRTGIFAGGGDSTATLCPSRGMALKIMSLCNRTWFLCTCMAPENASKCGYI